MKSSRSAEQLTTEFASKSTRSHISSLVAENYRYRQEAIGFLQQEARYGIRLCETRDPKNSSTFYSDLVNRLACLEIALRRLSRHLTTVFEGFLFEQSVSPKDWYGTEMFSLLGLIDESLASLSQTIQDTASALGNRLHRGGLSVPKLQAFPIWHRMRLSEVHLDYSDTFRAVQHILHDYHVEMARSFFPRSIYGTLSAPILVVTRGDTFAFEFYSPDSRMPVFVPSEGPVPSSTEQLPFTRPFDFGPFLASSKSSYVRQRCTQPYTLGSDPHRFYHDFIQFVKFTIPFSRVVAPRYFPVMIRYSPIFAHELMHAVLRVAGRLLIMSDQAHSDKESSPIVFHDSRDESQVKDLLWKEHVASTKILYGTHLTEVAHAVPDLAKIVDRTVAEYATGEELISSDKYAMELIADVGALVYGKQAFLSALVFHSYSSRIECSESLSGKSSDDHPPISIRLPILFDIANVMGFSGTVTRLQHYLARHKQWCGNVKPCSKLFKHWQKEWTENGEGMIRLRGLAKALLSDMRHSQLYERCASRFDEKGFAIEFNEGMLERVFQVLIEKLSINDLIWRDIELPPDLHVELKFQPNEKLRLTPSDVMNVMWHKLLDRRYRGDQRQRIQWRAILSKSFGGVDGK